jgi:hypothetical protein
MAELNDELFDGLDSKMDFLNEPTKTNTDGIYRVDLSKVKDKKKGYRAVVRFLPNLTTEGKLGQSAIEKISHYVDIKNPKELSGYFDSPKNFEEKCPLSDLYFNLTNSKNAILVEKAKCLKYSRKYYSYVLIIEDDQQPELVGKIMIMQYGVTIKDKIMAERNGEITGVGCNVFDPAEGKDFVLVVKEISTGSETYPDYKMSMFKPETSSLPIYFKDRGVFKNAPTDENGKITREAQSKIREFLLDRDHNVEDFGPKKLTDDQQSKITEITNYLTGKASQSFNNSNNSSATTEDFEFEDNFGVNEEASTVDDDDDFFN